jgi:NADH-dependent peroxiredoxin subunit C
MSLQVGGKAPDFEVQAYHKGQFIPVKLSDYKGKWVMLVFYPGDFTFVCTTELAEAANSYKTFTDMGVEVLACSVDSHFVHKAWHDTELSKMVPDGIPYPLISDADGSVGRAYGVYDDANKINIRGRFLIDPDGIVQAAMVLTPPVGWNVDEAIRLVQAFQLVRASNGAVVCPSSWKPGKATLKPGAELVGKVWETWKK